ncbi:ead/Ea22-like family protein [Herminiimonas contaminans]|uniref:Ead/Ea22-like family protein n=1 Tax=Herminiimonas contaminans TaxID=1111140 RepID=A0ABS0ESC1_9BURK|nr:ead/Ea22-like family protein [Herminiimonas contaminans]MBF8177701.1 ead/Ea22-like family protein [Herminiimonas contaminans]
MIGVKELRRLAEAATNSDEWKFYESGSQITFRVRSGMQAIFKLGRMHHELNAEVRANAAYVESCNPSAILSLLDHIEQQEAEIARLRKDVAEIGKAKEDK